MIFILRRKRVSCNIPGSVLRFFPTFTHDLDMITVFLLFLLVTCVVCKCPDPDLDSEWDQKDEQCREQDPNKRYHCQYDIKNDVTLPTCAPAVNCPSGTYAKLDLSSETVRCVPCSEDMYQTSARISYKFTQPNCDHRKVPCDESEIQCEPATAFNNYKCRCDYRKGNKPNNVDCDKCFTTRTGICECIPAACAEGETLAANFSCVGLYNHQSPSEEMTTPQTEPVPPSNTGMTVGLPVGIVVGLLFVIALVVFIYYWRKRKGRNSRSASSNNSHSQGLTSSRPNSIISDNRDEDPESVTTETPFLDVGTQSASAQVDESEIERENEKKKDELFKGIKLTFCRHVDPKDLLVRLDLSENDMERIRIRNDHQGREQAALLLLQTVKRTCPNWFDCIISALKDPDIGQEHLVDKMKAVEAKIYGTKEDIQNGQQVDEPVHTEHPDGPCRTDGCEACSKMPEQETKEAKSDLDVETIREETNRRGSISLKKDIHQNTSNGTANNTVSGNDVNEEESIALGNNPCNTEGHKRRGSINLGDMPDGPDNSLTDIKVVADGDSTERKVIDV